MKLKKRGNWFRIWIFYVSSGILCHRRGLSPTPFSFSSSFHIFILMFSYHQSYHFYCSIITSVTYFFLFPPVQGGNTGFSIGATNKANVLSLVIGPGAGYNLVSCNYFGWVFWQFRWLKMVVLDYIIPRCINFVFNVYPRMWHLKKKKLCY